jgi:hypothetical protein
VGVTFVGLPEGKCQRNTDCNVTSECDLSTTSQVCRCNRGLDQCQAVGQCKPLPPPREATPCERCNSCVLGVQPTIGTLLATNASTKAITDALYSWCSSAGYSLTSCQTLSTVVTASFRGNLGLRAGAVCARLGECAASLVGSTTCSIVLVSGTAGAPLDVCSVNGVVGGSRVSGVFGDAGETHVPHPCALVHRQHVDCMAVSSVLATFNALNLASTLYIACHTSGWQQPHIACCCGNAFHFCARFS